MLFVAVADLNETIARQPSLNDLPETGEITAMLADGRKDLADSQADASDAPYQV